MVFVMSVVSVISANDYPALSPLVSCGCLSSSSLFFCRFRDSNVFVKGDPHANHRCGKTTGLEMPEKSRVS